MEILWLMWGPYEVQKEQAVKKGAAFKSQWVKIKLGNKEMEMALTSGFHNLLNSEGHTILWKTLH